jgi:predicted PurR-regulated permease PerM
MFLVAFYGMLIDGDCLARWLIRTIPLPPGQTKEILQEFRRVSRSVLRSTLLTALVQAAIAVVGYVITGVPQPVFFGVLTFFAAFLPTLGTGLVAVPLAGLLLLSGQTWQGIFLAAWGVLVVGLVDNLLKPILIRGDAEMHGVLVFFSLIGGVIVFGAVGLVVGPVALSFLFAVIRLGARDLVDES